MIKVFSRRLLAIFAFLVAYAPIVALIGLLILPDKDIFLYMALFVVAMLAGMLIETATYRIEFLSLVLGVPVSFVLLVTLYLASSIEKTPVGQFWCLLCSVVYYYGYRQGENAYLKQWYEIVPPALNVTFLFVYFVLIFVISVLGSFGVYAYALMAMVLISAVFGIIMMNRSSVMTQLNRGAKYKRKNKKDKKRAVSAGTQKNMIPVSPSLRRNNTAIIAFMLVLVIALIPLVSVGLGRLGEAIVTMLNTRSEAEQGEAPKTEIANPGQIAITSGESNPLLTEIINIICYSIFGIIIAVCIFLAIKKLRVLVIKLIQGLRRKDKKKKRRDKLDIENEMYDEIIEDIDIKLWGGKKLRDIIKEKIGWYAMRTEEEKVRYLFRYVVKRAKSKGYYHTSAKTPFETLGEIAYADREGDRERAYRELADSYNRTRYDSNPPKDGETVILRNALR